MGGHRRRGPGLLRACRILYVGSSTVKRAVSKLLMLRCVVSLNILSALSIFTVHKLLTATKMLKMLKMLILSRSVLLMIIFEGSVLASLPASHPAE